MQNNSNKLKSQIKNIINKNRFLSLVKKDQPKKVVSVRFIPEEEAEHNEGKFPQDEVIHSSAPSPPIITKVLSLPKLDNIRKSFSQKIELVESSPKIS